MMNSVIIGKTITPNEKRLFRNHLNVLCEFVENNLMVSGVEYGLEFNCIRERTRQKSDKHDNETGALG